MNHKSFWTRFKHFLCRLRGLGHHLSIRCATVEENALLVTYDADGKRQEPNERPIRLWMNCRRCSYERELRGAAFITRSDFFVATPEAGDHA